MSLLGHLVPRIASSGAEPAATQALAYILNASPGMATAFVDVVGRTGIVPFTPGRIAAEEQHGDVFPDVTVHGEDGAVRILVENKFWAGLTDAQPLAYLNELPREGSAALVFVVPHQRMYGLWGELKKKCRAQRVELEGESTPDTIKWARAGHHTLAITSWKHVLGSLEQAARAEGHTELQQDIVQLRGLTDSQNVSEFLPLRDDELTDVNVARRMINYTGLIDEIAGRLVTDGIAQKERLRPSHDYKKTGRYIRLHGKFEAWLGVDLDAWRDWGITPIWSKHHTNSAYSGIEGKIRQAAALFESAQERDSRLYVPIRLTTKAERDRVVQDAAEQMRDIADRLQEAFPAE